LFRKKRDEENRHCYIQSRKSYKSLVKQKKREYKKNLAEQLKNNVNDSERFWKDIKKLGCCKKSEISDKIKLDEWFIHFENVFKQCEEIFCENIAESDVNENSDHELNCEITEEEVKCAITSLNSGKAGGTDGIVAEMLKGGNSEVLSFLVKLYNKVFNSGIYPDDWSKAIVVPIHKKGNTEQTDNYRGISLINTVSKCYSNILNKRLYTWLEENNKITENQAGFRQQYSTADQIFNLYAAIQKGMCKKGSKVYVAFVDFRKAFDSVNRTKLLNTIYKEGIMGKFFCAIKAMYNSLTSCIRLNGEYSHFFNCPVGVRQGCVLSPTLFSLFINQLANYINENGVHGVQFLPNYLELFILLFADDVALISTTPRGLQNQLDLLKACCDRINLKVNEDKTKIIVFRKGGYLGQRERWFFEGKELEVVNKYCYLGYNFTTMLSFKQGTSQLVAKGKKVVYLLYSAFRKCRDMTPSVFFRIFDAKVQSILLYSAELWGYQRLDCIEKVHLLACKRFLGVPIKTPNKMVYGELGRYPLYINSAIRSLKYWFRLLQMESNRLPKQAYSMMYVLDQNGKRCWASEIRELLSKMGFYYVWVNQGVNNIDVFLEEFKQRLIGQFAQEWESTVRGKERYILYSLTTDKFHTVEYINDISIYCFRVALTQTRCGVLPINNNMNRYGFNTKASFCPFCDHQIEDEKHFMFNCPMYNDLRERFLVNKHPYQMYNLLKGNHYPTSILVAKYVCYSMKRRQLHLSNML
jgi:hypothetical protein